MKIGLIHATKTGHSKKIANTIAQELRIDAKDIRSRPDLEAVDLLYIVGGIYGGKSAPELVRFAQKITPQQAKRAALIASSGGKVGQQQEVREALEANGVDVMEEEFACQGGLLFVGIGHPNAEDIRNAVAFAKRASAAV